MFGGGDCRALICPLRGCSVVSMLCGSEKGPRRLRIRLRKEIWYDAFRPFDF